VDFGKGKQFLRAGKPKQGSFGQATLKKVLLGGENLNKLVRAGGNLATQGFLQDTSGGRADFKGSTS